MNPWGDYPVPPMRHEALYGDRVVRCFADRPRSLRALFDEAKATLDSEVALAKTIGTIAGVSLQRMALWGTIALLFAFVGLLTLAVGMVIALAVVMWATRQIDWSAVRGGDDEPKATEDVAELSPA